MKHIFEQYKLRFYFCCLRYNEWSGNIQNRSIIVKMLILLDYGTRYHMYFLQKESLKSDNNVWTCNSIYVSIQLNKLKRKTKGEFTVSCLTYQPMGVNGVCKNKCWIAISGFPSHRVHKVYPKRKRLKKHFFTMTCLHDNDIFPA